MFYCGRRHYYYTISWSLLQMNKVSLFSNVNLSKRIYKQHWSRLKMKTLTIRGFEKLDRKKNETASGLPLTASRFNKAVWWNCKGQLFLEGRVKCVGAPRDTSMENQRQWGWGALRSSPQTLPCMYLGCFSKQFKFPPPTLSKPLIQTAPKLRGKLQTRQKYF